MNKLRVKKKSEYIIEVNDEGETISFNVEDPSLPLRAEKAYEEVKNIEQKARAKLHVVSKKEDFKSSSSILSDNERETLKVYDQMFMDMRKAMDSFLGKGACQKIFGDTNYLTMYDELFEELGPHFEIMGINAGTFIESIKKKYGNTDNEEILEA